MSPCQPTKRKAEVDHVNKPAVKKMKEDRPVPQFLDMSYRARVRVVCEFSIIYAVKFSVKF